MELIRLCSDGAAERSGASVVALGCFDGVHLGHGRLLCAVLDLSRAHAATPSVFTFSDEVNHIKSGAARLTDLKAKLALFERAGIERVYVADFSAISGLSPEAFVSEILLSRCGAIHAVCGFNFRFGHGAAGDAERLLSLMRAAGGDASIVPAAQLEGRLISSRAIRAAIEAGDMPYAAAMLGRPFSLTAPVLRGRGFGHTEGVPTVNQAFGQGEVLPRCGVYACRVRFSDGREMPAVTNVGSCPTFGDAAGEGLHAETHLIGYEGELYGETLTVEFLHYLRPERKFETVRALYEQITRDVEAARTFCQ